MQEDTDGFSHIFYQHQDLFEKQKEVDDLVDDIAFNLGIGRADLNIVRIVSQILQELPLTIPGCRFKGSIGWAFDHRPSGWQYAEHFLRRSGR